MTKFLGYGYFKFYYVPSAGGSTIHPVVQNWMSRVVANSGTYDSKDVTALNNLVKTWEAAGIIESGLTSGQVSSASTIQYALPCCGTNSIAGRTALLYRSGSNATATLEASPSYNTGTKSWTGGVAPGGGLNTGYVYSSYSSDNTNGFICIRTNTSSRVSGYSNQATISTLYATGTGQRALILPNYYGSLYGDFYDTASGRLAYTIPTPSATQQVMLRNSVTSGTTSASLYLGNNLVASGSTAAGTLPNTPILLGGYEVSETNTTETEPYTFFACSVTGIPDAKISGFISSIETFRASVV